MEIDLLQVVSQEELNEIDNLDFGALDSLESEIEIWEKARADKFTFSEFHRLMGYEDKKELSKGAETYILEKVLNSETEQPKKELYGKSIEHGEEFETEAAEEFMKETGKVVTKYGKDQEFIEVNKRVGGTPDGLVDSDGLLETKCPDSKTHYYYLTKLNSDNFKSEKPEYYWQIQGGLWATDRKIGYFVSYDPRFKNPKKRLHIVIVYRNDEDIKKLRSRLSLAKQSFEKQVEFLRN